VNNTTILIVDDEKNILGSLKTALSLEGFTIVLADSGESALSILARKTIDLVLLDVKLPGMNGMDVLKSIRKSDSTLPVIMMSGHGTIQTALDAVRLGAFDFIEKPLSTDRLMVTISNVLKMNRLQQENDELRTSDDNYQLVGSSKAMQEIADKIKITANTMSRVLILGENGTGKELVARAIHGLSGRAGKPFIKVNCAAIPDDLIESELFGHVKGAFTGAMAARKGKFSLANGGTIFLDEIGDMKLEMQSKLLRVLQEGEFEPVGGEETISVDVRVISATNRDLDAMIASDEFRQDLYYRLAVIPITIPPLQDRLDDIEELTLHFSSLICAEYSRPEVTFSNEAIAELKKYNWPGNVRELRNMVERIIILNQKSSIEAADVTALISSGSSQAETIATFGQPLRELSSNFEKLVIERALDRNDNNVTNTARELDLERSHLYKKMKAYDINPRD